MTTPMQLAPNRRRRGGLESVAAPLGLPESDWRVGVGYTPAGPPSLFVWPVTCSSTPDLAVKPLQDGVEPQVVFEPFVIGAGATCGPGRGPLGDAPRILAESALELNRYSLLAEAMFSGGTGGDEVNPSLSDLGVVAGAAGGQNVPATVSQLLEQVCEFGGGDYVFHAPLEALPYVKAALGLTWDATRNVWAYGEFDFSFDCYPNLGPDDAAAPDGAFWIWLTRRPLVAFADDSTTAIGFDSRINERIVIAEQEAIVVFDPSAVAAGLAVTT